MTMGRTILITGATSGIGRAVAWEMARRGYNLGLAGRRQGVLAQLRQEILGEHPTLRVEIGKMDVRDSGAVFSAMEELIELLGDVDILLVNAGIAPGGKIGQSDFNTAKEVIDTNLIGAMATVDAGVAHFLKKGKGHVVGTSSISALRGLPNASAYCASKAGFATYLEALRAEVLRKGIKVTVLYPGYIDTPLNSMMKSRPFLISAEKGARQIANLIERRKKSSAVPPWPWNFIGKVMKRLPVRIIAGM